MAREPDERTEERGPGNYDFGYHGQQSGPSVTVYVPNPHEDMLRTLRRNVPPLPLREDNEAIIRWGGTSNFYDSRLAFEYQRRTQSPTAWREFSRQTRNVRVENPEDPSQYVVVEVIDSITFSRTGSDGQTEYRTDYYNS